ncbi:MAG: DUF4012 domain-containing protein [Dehalococcoidia bacterium]|nr:DUF4012 domain-containing protein [Dehalococcoidia bacterium]
MRVLNTGASAMRRLVSALLRLRRRNPKLFIAGGLAAVLVAAITGYAGVVYASVQRASADAQALQDEVQGISPLSLAQPATYADVGDLASRIQQSSASARRWLTPLRAFLWVPSLGPRAREGLRLLDAANSAARVARLLSNAFGSAMNVPDNQSLSPETAALVASVLRANSAQILEAHQELERLSGLLNDLGDTGIGVRTRERFDQYLPFLEAVLYLARVSPEVAGDAYVLYRALDSLRKWTDDPLKVMENPAEVRGSLETVDAQSVMVARRLDVVLLTSTGTADSQLVLSAPAREALTLIHQQLLLLNRVTKGLDALVVVAELSSDEGMLTEAFGARAKGELERAIREFQLAQQELAALQTLISTQKIISQDTYSSLLASALGSASASPDFLAGLLDDMSLFTQFMHTFLGYDGPRTYLLLGQNENEIRATGGFIGTTAQLTIDGGVLGEIKYFNSESVDSKPYTSNPIAPPGLYWYLWMERMLFRDANWNPSFPASATTLAEIYRRSTEVQVDGVMVGTKGTILDLIDLFGDIKVPGIPKVLDRQTARAYMEEEVEYTCRPDHAIDHPKRCFDEDLFFAVLGRLQGGVEESQRPALASLLRTKLESKDILIHLFQGAGADFLWERGWNGAIQPVDYDFLMIVDSSLPGHSVIDVSRSWEYQVRLAVDKPMTAKLRLHYDNAKPPQGAVCRQAEELGTGRCFWNYLRVYTSSLASNALAPPVLLHEGSEKLAWGYVDLDTVTVARQTGGGLSGLTEIGAYVVAEPTGVTTLPLQWTLDPAVLRQTGSQVYEYRLQIQKQPGMDRDKIVVAVQLPPGAGFVAASPGAAYREGGWVVLESGLPSDLPFFVMFRAPTK